MTDDPKVKSFFQTSYASFSSFYIKSICIKSYIYIIGGLCVILEVQKEGLSLEFELE